MLNQDCALINTAKIHDLAIQLEQDSLLYRICISLLTPQSIETAKLLPVDTAVSNMLKYCNLALKYRVLCHT